MPKPYTLYYPVSASAFGWRPRFAEATRESSLQSDLADNGSLGFRDEGSGFRDEGFAFRGLKWERKRIKQQFSKIRGLHPSKSNNGKSLKPDTTLLAEEFKRLQSNTGIDFGAL